MRRLTGREKQLINERETKKAKQDFEGFKRAMAKNQCWICKRSLGSFEEADPCMHWLLMPPGFRKKHFPLIHQNFSVHRIESFLRWIVAATGPFKGINDLRDEHTESKVMAVTIKHGDYEWSLDCAKGCFMGLHGKQPPHYHFQMRIKGKPFIDYSDFHIPLTHYDLWVIDIKLGNNPDIRFADMYGMGIKKAMEDIEPEVLLENMRAMDDFDQAPFHLQTMVVAEPGKTISGDEVADLIRESRETGIPLAKLARRIKNARVQTIINPGPAIPEAANRTPRKRGRKAS